VLVHYTFLANGRVKNIVPQRAPV